MMDCIWMARNRLVHDSVRLDPPVLLQQILKCYREHASAWSNLPMLRKKFPVQCLCSGEIRRMTFDVAIRPQFTTCAAVLFHPTGDIPRAWTNILPAMDPLSGEAEAAWLASCFQST